MRRVAFVLVALVAFVLVLACTPQERRDLAPAAVPAVRATCIVLRAFVDSGRLAEICATAEELAPYVPDLLAQREALSRDVARGAHAPGDANTIAGVGEYAVGVELESVPAARRRPVRRCVAWETTGDGGLPRRRDAGGAHVE